MQQHHWVFLLVLGAITLYVVHFNYDLFSLRPLAPSFEDNAIDTQVSHDSNPPSFEYDPNDKRYTYGSYKSKISPDEKYFTYLPMGGINNQFIALLHAMRMAQRLNRTLIVPPIGPNLHINSWNGPPYSEFYDLARFQAETGVRVIEWHDLKPQAATTTPPKQIMNNWTKYSEPMQCYIRSLIGAGKSRHYRLTDRMRRQMMLNMKFRYFPQDPSNGVTITLDEFTEVFSKADDDLLCVTDAYHLHVNETEIWDDLGSMLYFAKGFEEIVDGYATSVLPPSNASNFIGVHLRRGDINTKCGFDKSDPIDVWRNSSCFLSIDKIKKVVDKIQGIREQESLPVVVATNEKDEGELNRMRDLGWALIDHNALETVQKYGYFYPPQLDAALLVRAKWFLGSRKSAMSKFITERSRTWHNHWTTLM